MKPNVELKPLIGAFLARFGADDAGVVAAIDLAVLVALADGTIDAAERAALAGAIDAVMGAAVAPTVARYLVRESSNHIQASGVEARARAIGGVLAERGAVDEGLRLALAVAFASEGLAPAERACIGVMARAAGATDARLEALIAAAARTAGEEAPAPAAEG